MRILRLCVNWRFWNPVKFNDRIMNFSNGRCYLTAHILYLLTSFTQSLSSLSIVYVVYSTLSFAHHSFMLLQFFTSCSLDSQRNSWLWFSLIWLLASAFSSQCEAIAASSCFSITFMSSSLSNALFIIFLFCLFTFFLWCVTAVRRLDIFYNSLCISLMVALAIVLVINVDFVIFFTVKYFFVFALISLTNCLLLLVWLFMTCRSLSSTLHSSDLLSVQLWSLRLFLWILCVSASNQHRCHTAIYPKGKESQCALLYKITVIRIYVTHAHAYPWECAFTDCVWRISVEWLL